MTVSSSDLNQVSRLAYLEADTEEIQQLSLEINDILDFVEQLKNVNTKQVEPLFHPLNLTQRLRDDEVTEKNCVDKLAELAPQFSEGFYLVPKFMDTEQ